MMGRPAVEVWKSTDETVETANQKLAQTEATHVVWLESAGHLLPGSLEAIESTLASFDVDLLYGDSRGPDAGGSTITERPAFSPLRLREQNYLGPVIVMSVSWMRSVGGFDERAQGVHGYDFALRFEDAPARTVRVPQPLSFDSEADENGAAELAAVRRRLASLHSVAEVTVRPNGTRRVAYRPLGEPLVSVIIPTRGSSADIRGNRVTLVVEAVRSLIERTSYSNIEVIVVADDPTPQRVIDELRQMAGDRLRVVRYSDPFNFSAKINRGAAYAGGELLLLLNDDVEVIDEEWLSILVGLAQQPGVGIVGSLLLFEDGSVQHGGHLYRESWAGHVESPQEIGGPDALRAFALTREVSGVTAACALLTAVNFARVGGLSTLFPGNYNDVDLSLKIRSTGNSAVWSPDARLFHFESKSRDATILPHEIALLRQRWGTRLLLDQYWAE